MDDIDKRDLYEERAAIYEFEAGMRRGAAEAKAWQEVYGINPGDTSHAAPPA